MSDAGEDTPDDGPLRLRNLQAMLKWAAAHGSHGTAPEDAITPENNPDFEEKRRFLLDAVKSLTVDLVEKMIAAVKVLSDVDDSVEDAAEQKEGAMDELLDLIEDLDNADDFRKMGGFDLCLVAIDSVHPGVQWRAAECLATAVQNHFPLQKELHLRGGLPKLMAALENPVANPTVRTKVARALSCLVGGHEVAIAAFVAADGFALVAKTMADEGGSAANPKLAVKLAFLVAALAQGRASVAASASRAGVVEELVKALPGGPPFDESYETSAVWEHGLRAVVAIGAACHEGHAKVKGHAASIAPLLAARKAFVEARATEDRPAYEEEEGFAKSLNVLLDAKVGSGGGASGGGGAAASTVPTTPQLALPLAPGDGGEVVGGTWNPQTGASKSSDGTPRPQEDFMATTEWQSVYDHHILPAGCDIKVDLQTGIKFARISAPRK